MSDDDLALGSVALDVFVLPHFAFSAALPPAVAATNASFFLACQAVALVTLAKVQHRSGQCNPPSQHNQ